MKAKIHPQYFEDLKIVCSCGNIIIAGSTKKELKTEVCSACHPFYTGQQKLLDTTGRVDKFLAKVKKAQKIKEKEVEVIDTELEEILEPEAKTEEKAPAPEASEETKTSATKKPSAKKTAAAKVTKKKSK